MPYKGYKESIASDKTEQRILTNKLKTVTEGKKLLEN